MEVFKECVMAQKSDSENVLWPNNLILKCVMAQQVVLRPYGPLIYDHSLRPNSTDHKIIDYIYIAHTPVSVIRWTIQNPADRSEFKPEGGGSHPPGSFSWRIGLRIDFRG